MTIKEIKDYMKKNGISQIKLAEMSNIPLQTIRHIFCGHVKHPRIDTMQAIETALGLNKKTVEDNTTTEKKQLYINLVKAGLTEENYNKMSEQQREDLLNIIKITVKNIKDIK